MGKEFYQNYPSIRHLFDQASHVLEMDFKKLCFDGPESLLVKTENVQPAILLINIACLQVLKEEGIFPSACAGHSLGEYAALFAAGAIDFSDVLKVIQFRATFMKDAAEKNSGGMLAIIGLEVNKVREVCHKLQDIGMVSIANINSPSQIIVTGEEKPLQELPSLAKEAGGKFIISLNVAGPWHSKYMLDASDRMENVLQHFNFTRPLIPFITNVSADYESDPEVIKRNLATQLTSPVLWADSMQKFIVDGYDLFIEAGPKRVLTGLMRDINRQAKTYNVENMQSLKRFLNSENNLQ
jgi:[acyl-carrier-protein] S-malonyltransferase